MITIQLKCEKEAQIYLNAHNYRNLLSDLYGALLAARKHGGDKDVLYQVEHFMPDIGKAVEHHLGAY